VAAALAHRSAIEPNVEVRSQLACSAKRLPSRDALPIVRALLARSEDAADIHLPLLLWWAIESQVASDPEAVLALFQDRSTWELPIVRTTIQERLMRRLAAAGTRPDLARCARLLALAPGPDHTRRLMAGFEAAYAGRSLAGLPAELAGALARFSGQSITLGLRQGKPEALAEALRLLADNHGDRAKQLQLLQVLGEVRRKGCVPIVLKLACHSPDNALSSAALAALAAYDDPAIPEEVLKTYPNISDDVLAAALNLMASRRPWASRLLEAIEAKAIDPHTVPREVVERLVVLGDAGIDERVARLFGPIRPATSAELRTEVDRLAAVVRAGSGIPKPGKQIFDRQCARCHALFGKGGKVGPELTTYRRDDIDSMLLNIVNPSAEIREGYLTSIIATTDGRVLTGVVLEQDKNAVVVRLDDGKELTIARDDIDAIKPSPKSIMPERLLKDLDDQGVRDLFAYLRSTQPLID
jgi:putative heme-binding domain-containing protein